MGPLVTTQAQKRVLGFIDSAKSEGATLKFGGGVPSGLEAGCFVEPTLFSDVNNDMTIGREEIFDRLHPSYRLILKKKLLRWLTILSMVYVLLSGQAMSAEPITYLKLRIRNGLCEL